MGPVVRVNLNQGRMGDVIMKTSYIRDYYFMTLDTYVLYVYIQVYYMYNCIRLTGFRSFAHNLLGLQCNHSIAHVYFI